MNICVVERALWQTGQDWMGQNYTAQQYSKLWVSVDQQINAEITLACSLTWWTDCWSPLRMASKLILNAKIALFSCFLFCYNKNARMGPILKQCSIKSSLPSPTLYPTHVIFFTFLYYTNDLKLVVDLGTRLFSGPGHVPCTSHFLPWFIVSHPMVPVSMNIGRE